MRIERNFRSRRLVVSVISLLSVLIAPLAALSQTFTNGDVFVAIGSAQVQWRHANGSLVKTLVVPASSNRFTTGMAFDSVGNLYVTMFDSQAVAVFDNTGAFVKMFGSGYNSDPESIVIDSGGNVYVGQADGTHQILKFNLAGTPLAQYPITSDRRGSDWIDLSDDLCTMYYCSEGTHVEAFDVCTGAQLPNLNTTPLPGTAAYAHRLLANGDTLVADSEQIVRLDDTGALIQTYTVPGNNNFFALNLDHDGTSFWSGDLTSGNVFKFDIASGNILVQFNAGSSTNGVTVGGITVKGEITASGTPRTGLCATRNSRFWFTHALNTDSSTNCATLLQALQDNVGGISLGFLRLPAFFENSDNVKDVNDALIEALGFYWKSSAVTGEIGGTQNQKSGASALCKQRKLLAVELIAATANVRLVGTDPADCTYMNGGVVTNFPANLLEQARAALGGYDITAIISQKALLQKFNDGGQAVDFPPGIVECSPNTTKALKLLARDATRQDTCPGVNNSCGAAAVVSFANTNQFAPAVFTASANLNAYTNNFPVPTCGTGGRDAVWKILPTVGTAGRHFTVVSNGSNFDTMLSVWSGSCSNPTPVGCTNSVVGNGGETLVFNTDGTNTFFIVGEGSSGQFGKLKLTITSP
jgi:hypothetical protein